MREVVVKQGPSSQLLGFLPGRKVIDLNCRGDVGRVKSNSEPSRTSVAPHEDHRGESLMDDQCRGS